MDRVKLGVVRAGLIGKRHAECIAVEPKAMLFAIVDPSPVGKEFAGTLSTAWFTNFAEMTAAGRPDGVIIATPNQLHLQMGLEAVAAGMPPIVEKPIADSVAAATELVEAAEKAGTPLLVGHHRRYNPMIREAKTIVDSGRLGEIVAVHGAFWAMKPDNYFEVAWRREKGAGPVLFNLIHDVDLLRFLCGEVIAVQAMESNARRGNPVEDTTAILCDSQTARLAL